MSTERCTCTAGTLENGLLEAAEAANPYPPDERQARTALRIAVEAWAAPQWRSGLDDLSPLEGTIGAYVRGRNDSIDQIRAILAASA